MSEEVKEERGIKYLTPAGHNHPSTGKIDKYEQLLLSSHVAAAQALRKIEADINERPEKVDQHIIDAVADMVNYYTDFSGSLDGFRSKQIAKIGSSNAYVPKDEDGRGWLQRNFTKRKKEEVASEG